MKSNSFDGKVSPELLEELERLRSAEREQRILLNESSDPLFSYGPDFSYRYVNAAYADGIGRKVEDIIGKTIWDIFPKDQADARCAPIKWVFEHRERKVIEMQVPRDDGIHYYLTTLKPIFNDHGDVDFVLANSKEITAGKKVENALVRSELRFRSFVESANDVLFALSLSGTINYVSPQWKDAFGYEIDQALDQSFATFVHPDDIERCMQMLRQIMATGEKKGGIEFRVRTNDGSYKWYRAHGSRVEDPKDGSLVFFGIGRDISESKAAEEGLRLYREIFDSAKEAIFVSDLHGNLLDVNAAACKLAKYSRAEMLRLRNVDIVAKAEVSRIAPDLAMADAGQIVANRWLLLCSDGSTVPLDLVVQRLAGDKYLAIGRDLTEREKEVSELAAARDTAMAANLAKSRFLAAASHDLRQPIQAIGLFHHALQRTALSDEQKRIHSLLSLSVQNLGDLLNSLLDISRLDAGAVVPNFEAVGVRGLFQSLDSEFWPLADSKSLRLHFFYPRNDIAVLADSKLLNSMLGNLVGNAIKYTEHGQILVCARRRSGQALVQVWDTGIGIPAEHKEDIYEEYLQIGNPERDRTKGLGLGLAIVKRLATLMKTNVTFRSQLGRGSVFQFNLPLTEVPDSEAKTEQKRTDIKASNFGFRRVILVEDDAMVSAALALLLESMGMEVVTYFTAKDALAGSPMLEDSDFYLSDLRLPDLNGLEFLQLLQQRSARTIKAAILTGDTSPDRIEVIKSSPWPVLFKPIEISKLLWAMEEQYSAA